MTSSSVNANPVSYNIGWFANEVIVKSIRDSEKWYLAFSGPRRRCQMEMWRCWGSGTSVWRVPHRVHATSIARWQPEIHTALGDIHACGPSGHSKTHRGRALCARGYQERDIIRTMPWGTPGTRLVRKDHHCRCRSVHERRYMSQSIAAQEV